MKSRRLLDDLDIEGERAETVIAADHTEIHCWPSLTSQVWVMGFSYRAIRSG